MNSIEQIMNNNNINLALRVNVSMENKDLIFNLIDEILELIKKYRLILNFAPIDDDTDKNPNLMLMDDKTFAEYNFQYHEYLLKKDALFKALPRPRDIPCQAYHINSFVVAPGGELLTCNHDINDIANMKISTLDTPQNIDYHNLEIYHFQDIFGDSECSECQYLPLCMGYCTFLKRNNKPIKCLPKLMPLALLAYNMEEKLKEDL